MRLLDHAQRLLHLLPPVRTIMRGPKAVPHE